ncbi:hypothetical protein [Paenibacillus timonensis]|uniref:hypothetical protein n=1 Tax=Paenibacillus timonensis TaxID=225915 RepID=UPI001F06DD01|nr:hypothetical protein [Paenibacillus timonensis]
MTAKSKKSEASDNTVFTLRAIRPLDRQKLRSQEANQAINSCEAKSSTRAQAPLSLSGS